VTHAFFSDTCSLQCLGQSYAYNEACYFLIRLLQHFSSFTLAPEVQPEGSLPPPEWANRKGRQSIERIWPGAAMTLYVKVGAEAFLFRPFRCQRYEETDVNLWFLGAPSERAVCGSASGELGRRSAA
jgi:hypothetical protein